MPKRHSATAADPANPARPAIPVKPVKVTQSVRPPLPSTSRTYGKVTGHKGGKGSSPAVPKAFSHRKRG